MTSNKRSKKRSRGSSKKTRSAVRIRLINKLKLHISKNIIAILTILITIATSFIIYYLSYVQPDIHPIFGGAKPALCEPIDTKVDENQGVYITLCRARVRFKNLSIKSGYIDKVEFIQMNVDVVPDIKVTRIDKRPIHWREEKDVEIEYIVTIKIEDMLHQDEAVFDMVPYDNTGKPANIFENGEIFHYLSIQKFERIISK